MIISPINTTVVAASTSAQPPFFMYAVQNAIRRGDFEDTIFLKRSKTSHNAREIAIRIRSDNSDIYHEFQLCVSEHKQDKRLLLKGVDSNKTYTLFKIYVVRGYDPYDPTKGPENEKVIAHAAGNILHENLINALGPHMDPDWLIKMPITRIIDLASRYMSSFRHVAETFLDLPTSDLTPRQDS